MIGGSCSSALNCYAEDSDCNGWICSHYGLLWCSFYHYGGSIKWSSIRAAEYFCFRIFLAYKITGRYFCANILPKWNLVGPLHIWSDLYFNTMLSTTQGRKCLGFLHYTYSTLPLEVCDQILDFMCLIRSADDEVAGPSEESYVCLGALSLYQNGLVLMCVQRWREMWVSSGPS